MTVCRKSPSADVIRGYAVIEYLCREAMNAEGLEPDRIEWAAGEFLEKLHQMTVYLEDRMSVELFLEDELSYCFSIPEYYRSVERKIRMLVREIRDTGTPDLDDRVRAGVSPLWWAASTTEARLV